MDEEEARLRLALIAEVGNATGAETPAGDVRRAIDVAAGVAEAGLIVKLFHPANYLVECSSQSDRDHVLGASPVPLGASSLSLRPWTRLVQAEVDTLLFKVVIEIDGIPAHAWDDRTASKLLAPHAWIERLDDTTERKEDLSTFKVVAWTKDPYTLPTSKTLLIAEHEEPIHYDDPVMQRVFGSLPTYLREKRMLAYPIHFHPRTIADFHPQSPSTGPSSPSDDGDSGPDGNPDRSYGFRQGNQGPRLTTMPRRDGRRTGIGRTAAAAGIYGGQVNSCKLATMEPGGDDRLGGGLAEKAERILDAGGDGLESSGSAARLLAGNGNDTATPVAANGDGPGTSGPAVRLPAGSGDDAAEPAMATGNVGPAEGRQSESRSAMVGPKANSAPVALVPARDSLTVVPSPVQPSLHMIPAASSPAPRPAQQLIDTQLHGADPVPVLPRAHATTLAKGQKEARSVVPCPGAGKPAPLVMQDPGSGGDKIDPVVRSPGTSVEATTMPEEQHASPVTDGIGPSAEEAEGPSDDKAQALSSFVSALTISLEAPLLSQEPDAQAMLPSARTLKVVAEKPYQKTGRQQPMIKRSARLAGQKLACVLAAKRGEVILMKKLGLLNEADLTPTAKAAYENIYNAKLDMECHGAIKSFFPPGSAEGGESPTISVV